MKKSVIIVIGIVYVLAIVVVSFFGLKMKDFGSNVYVESIEITNEEVELVKDSNGEYIKVIKFNYDEKQEFQLEWVVKPDNATYKDVNFGYDTSSTIGSVNQEGLVTFNRKGILTVHISSIDGSAKSDTVKVYAK